ncbi:pyruvate carboxylase [Phaeovibrio sulfidiphilus]|uniref:Pyruvate carboxylase n=1 Tax=Phaeovibrio sulfidiphilus TaxID=1220600 RepID=A0A8J6YID3_9PROT|nr:pyruvate carboxylase [Phaeovibrio sulfidiphilus]MBE1236801.1 pyruvate carboxylase [Phaeovibrio sulfidiphilus]
MSALQSRKIRKLLVANRGEIAIRIFRAANELGIRTVALYTEEDKLSLHRFKADESYLVGKGMGPVRAYLSIEEVIRVARACGADAIHPGYGFLSENPDFAEACAREGILFVGPPPDVMRVLGNKVSARDMAVRAGVAVMPATGPLSTDMAEVRKQAKAIGYPLMLKASWGGGGRGMRVIHSEKDLETQVDAGRREAESAFGNGEVYLEKLVQRARHVEVQILGDIYGTIVHLWERDCSVQRRNQKVVERAPAPYLNEEQRLALCESALSLAREANYVCAGTVEYLMDVDTGAFYFIEVNPRIQVEHTITEEITGIDIVKAQIRIIEGGHIGNPEETGVPAQPQIHHNGHAIQCRITTEDPEENFIPDYGRISAYRGATGFGIRLDGGTAYTDAVITRYYDSLLEKVTAWAPTPTEAIHRLDRALREFRIRGVATNLAFVENLINHPKFLEASYTTRFIDETPELFHFEKRQDRATRLLGFIADVTVNGNPEVKGRALPTPGLPPRVPELLRDEVPEGTRSRLLRDGPEAFARWMLGQKQALITDTTFRDAHQSLLATRLRTYDMLQIAEAYSRNLPQLFSLECWGGATFDVAMRFLHECPWERLVKLRERVPNILFQMLLRGANGVGYTVYPDNVVKGFVSRAAEAGVDVFRVFDSLNWVENMRVSMDAVLESGKLLEATICYTGDLFDSSRPKYNLGYYVKMAKELQKAGTHILGIKDMAGLVKPRAAFELVRALKEETGLPVHFHTHDTSGISAASVLEAIRAGADAVDAAMDSFSGLTSQPCMGSIVEALRFSDRETGIDPVVLRQISDYWEAVRRQYNGFESDMKAGASEVYLHEMPGGQFTNLKEQARSMGLEERWHEVARSYSDVNRMFGDIVKVTPSSKVVGDLALYMVGAGLTPEDVTDPARDISFPESVVQLMRGELGRPPEGFPQALQAKVLRGEKPMEGRPGALVPPADLKARRKEAEDKAGRPISDLEFESYLMYPKVFIDYVKTQKTNGPVSTLPTPVFFYGMKPGQEISVELETGKTIVVSCLGVGEVDEEGQVRVFFELNGQMRTVRVPDRSSGVVQQTREKADPTNPCHVAAPMPGLVASVGVQAGQTVHSGQTLMVIEAMKMETALAADRDGVIERVAVTPGTAVEAKDLLVIYKA